MRWFLVSGLEQIKKKILRIKHEFLKTGLISPFRPHKNDLKKLNIYIGKLIKKNYMLSQDLVYIIYNFYFL